MRRREFVSQLAGAAAAWPCVARAQQPTTPVIGFLRSTPADPFRHLVVAFQRGLRETGYVEGQNVAIEYRFADNHTDRLPDLAAELIGRPVAVIVGNGFAARVAKAATATIPIVFVSGDDPVKLGLVASFNRPGANVTGVTFFGGGSLDLKRLELLLELAPGAGVIGVLLDPDYVRFLPELPKVQAASRAKGRQITVVKATSEPEMEAAFAEMASAGAGALLVSGSPSFTSRRRTIIALAARHNIPAIYDQRDFAESGGLISYGASFTGAYQQAGVYAGHILKGAKPADMPVEQPTTFELVLNVTTAKALGLAIPESIFARADEVIE